MPVNETSIDFIVFENVSLLISDFGLLSSDSNLWRLSPTLQTPNGFKSLFLVDQSNRDNLINKFYKQKIEAHYSLRQFERTIFCKNVCLFFFFSNNKNCRLQRDLLDHYHYHGPIVRQINITAKETQALLDHSATYKLNLPYTPMQKSMNWSYFFRDKSFSFKLLIQSTATSLQIDELKKQR